MQTHAGLPGRGSGQLPPDLPEALDHAVQQLRLRYAPLHKIGIWKEVTLEAFGLHPLALQEGRIMAEAQKFLGIHPAAAGKDRGDLLQPEALHDGDRMAQHLAARDFAQHLGRSHARGKAVFTGLEPPAQAGKAQPDQIADVVRHKALVRQQRADPAHTRTRRNQHRDLRTRADRLTAEL